MNLKRDFDFIQCSGGGTFILALPEARLTEAEVLLRCHTCLLELMKMAKNGQLKQKSKFNSGVKPKKKQRKCVLMFNDEERQ